MPAYSSLKCPGSEDGAPDCANPFLLKQILRTQFNVPNISVISDNGAVDQVYSTHHYVDSEEMAAAVTINATTDIDLGNDAVFSKYLGPAVNDGLVTEDTITQSVCRSFYWRFKVGDFDPATMVSYQNIGTDHLNTKANQDLNLLSSQESLVLLKNLRGSLPLTASSIKKLAVIGPLAFSANPYLSNYQGIPDPNQMIPVSKGLQAFVPASATTTAPGCPSTQCPNTSDISAAVTAATGADVAVLVLGLDGSIEAEGKDRTAYPCEGVYPDALALPGCQLNLLKAVGAVTKVVLVLIHGGPVTIPDALQQDYVIGIIDAFYPGPRGGDAVASAIFGTYNPGGRLPTTMYTSSKDIPAITNYDMTTTPGFTYK
jgi:beta-D-xylosidase 4